MVPSKRYIKDGALVTLTADVRDNGRQAGEIVVEILNGADPKNISVATARTVEIGVNLRVAEIISLDVPQGMVDNASVVIE
jgi:putative ABC transport system substrate-binding protein